MLDRIASTHRAFVVVFTGTSHELREELFLHGVKPPHVRYERSIDTALRKLARERRA